MPLDIVLVAVVSDGLRRITVRYRDGRGSVRDQTLWSLGKQRIESTCVVCDAPQRKGTDTFRPITNKIYRGARLCMRCSESKGTD